VGFLQTGFQSGSQDLQVGFHKHAAGAGGHIEYLQTLSGKSLPTERSRVGQEAEVSLMLEQKDLARVRTWSIGKSRLVVDVFDK